MKKKSINLKKFCAVVTATCFFFMILSNNLFASVNISTMKEQQSLFSTKNTEQLNSLFLDKYGKVSEKANNSSNTVVINIQDLHCDYAVQKNIYSIINEIGQKYNISKIYVEGGYGNIDLSLLDKINEKFKDQLIEILLKESKITASEYYALKTNNENKLVGIEDKEIYLQNIERLRNILTNKEENSRRLASIEKEIDILKAKYLRNENKSFSDVISNYEKGNLEQDKYFKILMEYSDKFKIDTKNYKNMMSYLGLFDENNKINYGSLKKEIAQAINQLKVSLNYEQFYDITQATNNFNNFIEFKNVIDKYNKEYEKDLLKNSPNLKIYLELKEKTASFNPLELIKEEKKLVTAIRTYLSKDTIELEVAYLSDFEKYFKGYILASLTPAQWNYFKIGIDKFKELYSKYSISNDVNKIQNQFAQLDKFYETNDYRNEIFIKNMSLSTGKKYDVLDENNNIEQILSDAKEIVVLVSGGYHTSGINELLNKNGISHITIMPNVSSSDSTLAKERYDKIAMLFEEQKIALPLLSTVSLKEQILMIVSSLLQNSSLNGIKINTLVQQLNQIFAKNVEFSLIDDGKKLKANFKNKNVEGEVVSVSDVLSNSSLPNSANAIYVDEKGESDFILKVSDIVSAIELAAENGMNDMTIAWDDIIVDGKRGRAFSGEAELKLWMKKLSEELKKYGPEIKRKAEEKNITLSVHAMTFERKIEGTDNAYLPSPNVANWKDVYKFQIDIAKQLGVRSIVVHAINDYDSVDDWVDLINFAKEQGVVLNFENDMQYIKPQENLYNKSLSNGFIDSTEFIRFLDEISSRLSPEAKKYMGVCIDTARVFNAISSNQDLSVQERMEQINFDNLRTYINNVINAGYKINIIHLSQFDKSVTRQVDVDGQKKVVFYNKGNISNPGVISVSNLQELIDIIQKNNPEAVILQETGTDITKIESTKSEVVIDIDKELATVIEEQNVTQVPSGKFVNLTGEVLKELINVIRKTSFNCGTDVFAPQIYQISKDFCVFMVNKKNKKWYIGNGVIWDIANSKYNGETLDGVEPIVYEYMPEIMQKGLVSRQVGKDLISKNKKSNKLLAKIMALFLTVVVLFGSTGCSLKQEEKGLDPAPVKEIVEYTEKADNSIQIFNENGGYQAYLTSDLTQEEKDQWSDKEFHYIMSLYNTYDQAHACIVYLKMAEQEEHFALEDKANKEEHLKKMKDYLLKANTSLSFIQNKLAEDKKYIRSGGRVQNIYEIPKSSKEGKEDLGEIVWVGLAAVQYKLEIGSIDFDKLEIKSEDFFDELKIKSTDFDDLIISVDKYLEDREFSDGIGFYMGDPNMNFNNGGYASAEHQEDIIAYFVLKSLLSDEEWKTIIPEEVKKEVFPDNIDVDTATESQISEGIKRSRERNESLLLNCSNSFYKNMYVSSNLIRGYNDPYKVLDVNTWGIQVIFLLKQYCPSVYEKSEIKNIDLSYLLESIEENFYVSDEELKENLSSKDYEKFKGYHLYTWSSEHFVDGNLNWSFEWSMQAATAYFLMGDYEQAKMIADDAARFAEEKGLPECVLPASNVNAVKNYSSYGWKIPSSPSFAATLTYILFEYGYLNANPEISSPFFPVDTDNNAVPSSILPKTVQELNNLISSGDFSVRKALWIILNTETVNSLFRPIDFVNSHLQTKGAKILTIITAIAFCFIFGILLSQAIPFIFAAIEAFTNAITVNIGTHLIIDYRFLKSIGLEESIRLYGKENVRLTERGIKIKNRERIIPIYVINDKPKNVKNLNLRPIPIKVKNEAGKFVKCWIGNYNGAAVVFAEGVNYQDIVEQFSKTRQFKSLSGISANVDVIEVDLNDENRDLSYSKSGNPLVGINFVKTNNIVDIQKEIALLNNKKVEAITINQNIAIFIDDSTKPETSNDILTLIDTYIDSDGLGTNAKILFTDSYINQIINLLEIELGSKEAAKSKFISMIKNLKDDNKEISVFFEEANVKSIDEKTKIIPENCIDYGIFSYIANGEYVDTITSTKSRVKIVSDLNKVEGFDGSLSVLRISSFKDEIAKTSGIFAFINSSLNIREMMENRKIEFVKQVAENFDFNQIPNIDINILAEMIISEKENKFKQFFDSKNSKYFQETDSILMYYNGLSNEKEKEVFANSILERMMAVNYLRSLEKDKAYYGLKDKRLEQVLAKALVEKYRIIKKYEDDKTFVVTGNNDIYEELEKMQNEKNAADFEIELNKKILALQKTAFEQNKTINEILAEENKKDIELEHANTIEDIIRLIPLSDRSLEFVSVEVKLMGTDTIKGILSAA